MEAQCRPMGRPRRSDFDLPPRVYRRGDSYYYVTREGRWVRLGNDRTKAKRLWSDYDLSPLTNTVAALVARYVADCTGNNAWGTRVAYTRAEKMIGRQEWGAFPVDQLAAPHIAQWRDSAGVGRISANTAISLLRVAFDKAVEWGWCATNPARGVAFNPGRERERRLLDSEYRAIRAQACPWLALAMDLDYVTAARPCDVLALKWDRVGEVVAIRQKKTKKQQAFVVTADVEEILREARSRPIVGLYVVATDKGRPISHRRLQKAWRSACDAAGVKDAQFRDIRAMAATDAEEAGEDYQALLGHATRRMSDRYIKAKRTQLVQPRKRKSIGSA